jgi:hypothetical protein
MAVKDYPRALADYEKYLTMVNKDAPNVRALVKLLSEDLSGTNK